MKKEFIGFYEPTQADEAWTNGTFAFDANTLLNLYRYTEVTRKDFLAALKTLKGKMFIPYQVAFEYQNNRLGVIKGLTKAYQDLISKIELDVEKVFTNTINQYKRHPSILIDNISKLFKDFVKNVSRELEEQKKKHPDFLTKDEILIELTDLFADCLGDVITKAELAKIYQDGKERYDNLIPPGFSDLENKKKKGERHVYGDLIIWKELINYSKTKKIPLIFVTDDRKEDWWTIEGGETIRPRPELIKEFFDITGIRILIYNADQFLSFAKTRGLVPAINDNTIKEVKEIRISDEVNSNAERLWKAEYPQYYLDRLNDQFGLKVNRMGVYGEPFTPAYVGSNFIRDYIYDPTLPGNELFRNPGNIDELIRNTYFYLDPKDNSRNDLFSPKTEAKVEDPEPKEPAKDTVMTENKPATEIKPAVPREENKSKDKS